MGDALLDAVSAGIRTFDLGRTFFVGMPQSPNHPPYWHALPRRHGDVSRADGGSAANDVIVTGTHVGTHIDALAHVSHEGRLHGDIDAYTAGLGGRYNELGVHTIEPMIRRGILLDIPRALGLDSNECPPAYEITVADLQAAEKLTGTLIDIGDVVLIRSGWGRQYENGAAAYVGAETGVPGIGASGARYLASKAIHAAGTDTIAFEWLAPNAGHGLLPVHRIMLVESGIYLIEAMELEELAEAHIYEFAFTVAPLKLYGATGSPVRPLALVSTVSQKRNTVR